MMLQTPWTTSHTTVYHKMKLLNSTDDDQESGKTISHTDGLIINIYKTRPMLCQMEVALEWPKSTDDAYSNWFSQMVYIRLAVHLVI